MTEDELEIAYAGLQSLINRIQTKDPTHYKKAKDRVENGT